MYKNNFLGVGSRSRIKHLPVTPANMPVFRTSEIQAVPAFPLPVIEIQAFPSAETPVFFFFSYITVLLEEDTVSDNVL